MRWCFVFLVFVTGCASQQPGEFVHRQGDEIMVCGQMVHTGTPVVLWTDPGGYDGYRVERRFVPYAEASWSATTRESKQLSTPNRYGIRDAVLSPSQLEQVRGGGWTLELLRETVDQIVIHYDADGTSRGCFQTLQDGRGLSTHFMIDLDGTVYQTLDVKEKAWHATIVNSKSIGIEIANRGSVSTPALLAEWYTTDANGHTQITIPQKLGTGGERTPNFTARPARDGPIRGQIQGESLVQYDYTPQQYAALIRLVATLCHTLPNIKCDYPRDAAGHLITHKLTDDQLMHYQGLLGHFHVQTNKVDPGPAFQWDPVVKGARSLLNEPALP